MDISKYVTNKDIQLSNDDFNIEKLEKDIRKGYVLSEEVDNARSEVEKSSTKKYTELETQFNDLNNRYTDLEARNVELANSNSDLKLRVGMVSKGFAEDKLEEVSKLRTSLYGDIKDDNEALDKIVENFGATYFPKVAEPTKPEVPEETPLGTTKTPENNEISVTRRTSLKDLIIKK